MKYIKNISKEKKCCFCSALRKRDESGHILFRGEDAFIIMNLYPYNVGHLMVAPYKHSGNIFELGEDELAEMAKLQKLSMKMIDMVYKPEGFNVGMNVGRVSGAGVVDHLHVHVVPRWKGDTNFISVFGETKVMSELIPVTYGKLKKACRKIMGGKA